jgi:hypothetical protein
MFREKEQPRSLGGGGVEGDLGKKKRQSSYKKDCKMDGRKR